MFESGYYPPGAEFDPNAPYNQPDDEWAYEKAADIIEEEMCSDNETFVEWLSDNEYLPIESNVTEQSYLAIIEQLANDDKVKEDYYEYRKEDVVTGVFEDACDDSEYLDEERDYEYEREFD